MIEKKKERNKEKKEKETKRKNTEETEKEREKERETVKEREILEEKDMDNFIIVKNISSSTSHKKKLPYVITGFQRFSS